MPAYQRRRQETRGYCRDVRGVSKGRSVEQNTRNSLHRGRRRRAVWATGRRLGIPRPLVDAERAGRASGRSCDGRLVMTSDTRRTAAAAAGTARARAASTQRPTIRAEIALVVRGTGQAAGARRHRLVRQHQRMRGPRSVCQRAGAEQRGRPQ